MNTATSSALTFRVRVAAARAKISSADTKLGTWTGNLTCPPCGDFCDGVVADVDGEVGTVEVADWLRVGSPCVEICGAVLGCASGDEEGDSVDDSALHCI